jgi:predicted AAA+ superfamily ATPase
MNKVDNDRLAVAIEALAHALEARQPSQTGIAAVGGADAFVWLPDKQTLSPVNDVNRVPLSLLQAINSQAGLLLENTRRFADGLPANNALLWGARGMGKSSLIKAIHAEVNTERAKPVGDAASLALVEIHREDIASLPTLMNSLRHLKRRFILFCDDLSFDGQDASYKSLKAVLEGGIEGRPAHVVFYATSNRRHLMLRDMMENERSTAINPSEAVEEKVSLSDRFGLWIGFHHCSQDDFLAMVACYSRHYGLPISDENLRREALQWAAGRGARSGRVAWQFIQDLAGRLGRKLDEPR